MLEHVHQLLQGSKGVLKSRETDAQVMKELRFMLRHIDQKKNELVFCRCVDPDCSHRTANPVKATELFAFLKPYDFKLFNPNPSEVNPGHYQSFLELSQAPPQQVQYGDKGMPSALLGRCQICKGYSFISQTDQSRNMSIFHPKPHKTQAATSRRQTPLVHKCTYYVVEAGECGAELHSLSKLRKHKKNTNHQKRCRKSGQKGGQTKKARGSAPLFQQYLQKHGLQHEDHSDTGWGAWSE